MWRNLDRVLGTYLLWLALFPMAFIALISTRTPAFDLLPASRGAGLLPRRRRVSRPSQPGRVEASATVAHAGRHSSSSSCSAACRRWCRSTGTDAGSSSARWLSGSSRSLSGGDAVYSDQHMVMRHYLKGREVGKLRPKPDELQETLRRHRGCRRTRGALDRRAATRARLPDEPEGGWPGRLDVPELSASEYGRHAAVSISASSTCRCTAAHRRPTLPSSRRCRPPLRPADLVAPHRADRRRDARRGAVPRQHLAVDCFPPIGDSAETVLRLHVLAPLLAQGAPLRRR